jgi:parallel beta-helix repeat protein
MHLEHVRVDVSDTGMRIEAVCGPPTSQDDITCVQGSVIDSYTIGVNPPPAPTAATGPLRRPRQLELHGHRLRHGDAAVLLDQAGGFDESSRARRCSSTRAPTTRESPCRARYRGGTDHLRRGAGRERDRHRRRRRSSNGFYDNGKPYVTIQGFTVTGTGGDGIVVKNASNVSLRSNHVLNSGSRPRGSSPRASASTGHRSVVATNTVDHNTDYGIYLVNASNRNQILANKVFRTLA